MTLLQDRYLFSGIKQGKDITLQGSLYVAFRRDGGKRSGRYSVKMAEEGSDPANYQGVVECDSCEGITDVNNYCIDCPGNICDKCKPVHCSTRLTKKHKVLPRTHPEVQRARRTKKSYCRQHQDVEYVTFCIKCQVPCCPRCIAGEHRGHDFSELFDEISKVEKELLEMALDLESSKIPEAKKTVDEIDRALLEYEERGYEVKKSVKDRIVEIHREVDKLGYGVLTTLENQRQKDIQQMQVIKKNISNNVAELTRRAETCRSAPADASLLLLRNKFTRLEPTQLISVQLPGTITFKKSTLKLPSSADLIGRIATGKLIDIDTSRKRDDSYHPAPFNDRMIEIKVIKVLENTKGDTILHMLNGQTWILDETAKTINIFGDRYNQIKKLHLGFTCNDMALSHTDNIIATDSNNNCIVRISSSGSITKLCSTTPLKPSGICVNKKQQIVVGVELVVVEGGIAIHGKLVVFSSNGSSVLQEIEYDQSGERLFTGSIYRVRQTVNGDFVVVDWARVMCLSEKFKVKWQYSVGSHKGIYGLCCDKYNNTFVDNRYKNKIVMLNSDGQLIKVLLTKNDGIYGPTSLSVDSNEHLWVGQSRNTLVVQYLACYLYLYQL